MKNIDRYELSSMLHQSFKVFMFINNMAHTVKLLAALFMAPNRTSSHLGANKRFNTKVK